MPSRFANDLKQFALAVDIVDSQVLEEVGRLLGAYFGGSLEAGTHEVRVEAPSGTGGERYLGTLWSSCGDRWTAPLRNDDGSVRGHTSYAVLHNAPLWIVSEDGGPLDKAKKYVDLWSGVEDLPAYRGWGDEHYRTSIILPIAKPPVGFLNLEFDERLEVCRGAMDELRQVAETVGIFHRLRRAYRAQRTNTKHAVRNLDAQIPHSPLRKRSLFFAFSSRADARVVGAVKQVLGQYKKKVFVVSWDEMRTSGNVNQQIRAAVESATYGVCYFSEPDAPPTTFRDNPNVVFEAGMFHAATSDQHGTTRWIPIRESASGPTPFDFAAERMVLVNRDDDGTLNEHALSAELRRRLDQLLDAV